VQLQLWPCQGRLDKGASTDEGQVVRIVHYLENLPLHQSYLCEAWLLQLLVRPGWQRSGRIWAPWVLLLYWCSLSNKIVSELLPVKPFQQ
jgi:hypothetical protein